jgi:DoxX-like family
LRARARGLRSRDDASLRAPEVVAVSHRLTERLYWGSTVLLSLLMLLSGAGDLFRFQPFVEDLRRLGYPDYLLTILGIAKPLGVAALLYPGIPRLKEWAYAGFAFDLGGATISQLVSGSTFVQILPPAVCGAVLAISYLAHRGRGRAWLERTPSPRTPGTWMRRRTATQ